MILLFFRSTVNSTGTWGKMVLPFASLLRWPNVHYIPPSLFSIITRFFLPLSLYFSDFVTLFFLFCLPPSLSNLSILQLLACIAMMRNVKDGAATTINCAVNPELNTQQCFYYSDCRPKEPIPIARSPIAIIMPTVLICAYKNSFVSMF